MSRKAPVEIPMIIDRDDASPFAVTQRVVGYLALIPTAVEDAWADELRAVSLAAAAAGDFQASIKGYEHLGKANGRLTDNPTAQHVHFHDAEVVKEQSTGDLEARLAHLRKPAPEPTTEPTTEPIIEPTTEPTTDELLA